MNVKNVAQFAKKVMTKAQGLPKLAKTGIKIGALGLVFGGGMLAEKSLVGDKFEKTNERLTAIESYLFTEALEKAKKSDTITVAQTDEAKPAEEKTEAVEDKNTFKYVPPEVDGERIATVEETKFAGTDVVERKVYRNKDGRYAWEEKFNKDGTLKSYTDYGSYETVKCGNHEYPCFDEYNANGEKIYYKCKWGNGIRYSYLLSNGDWATDIYDEKNRLTYSDHSVGEKGHLDRYTHSYTYNPDGSYSVKTEYSNDENYHDNYTEIEYFDKKGKLLKTKRFDYFNDILQYTVTPKYDKDGALIKNDTVRNK